MFVHQAWWPAALVFQVSFDDSSDLWIETTLRIYVETFNLWQSNVQQDTVQPEMLYLRKNPAAAWYSVRMMLVK